MENYELIYIEPKNPEIKQIRELIKKQGNQVCQNKIYIETISENVSNFKFGWISVLQKAQLGRRSIKSINDKFTLLSFILCHYTEHKPEYLKIELDCASNKSGKMLMGIAEDKARQMNIKGIEIYALPHSIKWYNSLGYIYIETIYLNNNVTPKIYTMFKKL